MDINYKQMMNLNDYKIMVLKKIQSRMLGFWATLWHLSSVFLFFETSGHWSILFDMSFIKRCLKLTVSQTLCLAPYIKRYEGHHV